MTERDFFDHERLRKNGTKPHAQPKIPRHKKGLCLIILRNGYAGQFQAAPRRDANPINPQRHSQALAKFLRGAASPEPFEAWFGPPEIAGRFGYNADFSGFNHDRKLATVDQLLALLLRQKGDAKPWSMYAGGIPIRKHLPGLLPTISVPLLDTGKATLISLWLGNRTRTAAHWDLPQNLACVVAGRRRFTLFPTEQLPARHASGHERPVGELGIARRRNRRPRRDDARAGKRQCEDEQSKAQTRP